MKQIKSHSPEWSREETPLSIPCTFPNPNIENKYYTSAYVCSIRHISSVEPYCLFIFSLLWSSCFLAPQCCFICLHTTKKKTKTKGCICLSKSWLPLEQETLQGCAFMIQPEFSFCCVPFAPLKWKQLWLPWKMPCGACRDLGLCDPRVNEGWGLKQQRSLHQGKTGLQKSVMISSKITRIMWKAPFNKAHLKVLTIACCATGYSPRATLCYDTIMGTFQHHYVIGGVSRGLLPA